MKSRLGVYALLALMPLLFSTNVVLGRALAGVIEPWTLAFWRWLLAVCIILPFALSGIAAARDSFRAVGREILILAFLGIFVCGGVVYMSLQLTIAMNASLIYSGSALFTVLLDAVWFRHRLTAVQTAGVVIGFGGVATIVLQGEPQRIFTLALNWGDLGIAFCALCWAVYTVMLKGGSLRGLPTLPLFALIAAAGVLMLIPPMLYEAVALGAVPTSRQAWLGIAALALLPSVLAYWFYQIGVREVGPSTTAVFIYLSPGYGVLLAVTLLGETFRAFHAVGLVLVISGVVLATAPFGRATVRA